MGCPISLYNAVKHASVLSQHQHAPGMLVLLSYLCPIVPVHTGNHSLCLPVWCKSKLLRTGKSMLHGSMTSVNHIDQ